MRFVPPNIHATMDYIMSTLLITSPWVFGFSDISSASFIAVFIGIISLVMTLITGFRCNFLRVIPVNVHLILDFVFGAFLALSPWIFDFNNIVYMPHLIFGILEIIASLTTAPVEYHGDFINNLN